MALEVRHVQAHELRINDMIAGGKSGSEITQLEVGHSCNGIHVNGKDCYKRYAWVPVIVLTRDFPHQLVSLGNG